ncbi:4-coumarate--CoA ligase 1 [Meiothermus ruber H328]|nr:4-coumarate--CoA ligase 1 [Meiothermus ruber H328]
MQLTVRWPRKSARAKAARLPQGQGFPPASRQVWLLSTASTPHRRMRTPWISRVSPSTTLARPTTVFWAKARLRAVRKQVKSRNMLPRMVVFSLCLAKDGCTSAPP